MYMVQTPARTRAQMTQSPNQRPAQWKLLRCAGSVEGSVSSRVAKTLLLLFFLVRILFVEVLFV